MILTDTGPLVALLDRSDPGYAKCSSAARALHDRPMITTWPCFTEAMYLLGEVGGYTYQEGLWALKKDGRLLLHELTHDEIDRMAALMAKYRDRPMDLADASLVAAAEGRSLRRLFTLDSDFRFYRLADGSVLDLIP